MPNLNVAGLVCCRERRAATASPDIDDPRSRSCGGVGGWTQSDLPMSERGRGRRHVANDALFIGKSTIVSLAAGVPIVGPQVATAINILEGERITKRLKAFMEEMRERVSRLEQEKLDRRYVETEEFRDVAMAAIEAAKRTSRADKRRWIASVLIGAARIDRPADLDAEALLDTLAGLTARELQMLNWLSLWRGDVHVAEMLPDLYVSDLDYHLHRLDAAGMIHFGPELPTRSGSADRRMISGTFTFNRLMALVSSGGGLDSLL